jgi:glutamate racemase
LAIDYLVLGCSHHPYLIPQIKKKFFLRSILSIQGGRGKTNKEYVGK